MDFKSATDRLAGVVTHSEIAEAAGVSVQTIRQARLDPAHPNYRPPPANWREVLVRLTKGRTAELDTFVATLEKSRT